MEKEFLVDIVHPAKTVYSGKAVSLVVPAHLGYLGILADHAALIAKTTAGTINIREGLGETKIIKSASSGVLEVLKNKVTILLDETSPGP